MVRVLLKTGCLCFVILAGAALLPQTLSAAQLERTNSDRCTYTLSGDIEDGDVTQLYGAEIPKGVSLCLNSLGGSFQEGLKIAEYLAGRNIETVVDSDAQCMSACALAFMGGTDFKREYIPRRTLYWGGQLGFHAPYLSLPQNVYSSEDVEVSYAAGLEAVAQMLELGRDGVGTQGFIPASFMARVLEAGPSDMYLIDDPAKALELGVVIKGAPKVFWSEEDARSACYVHNRLRHDAGGQQSYNTRTLADGGIEYRFAGFGDMALADCLVRVSADRQSAEIVSTFYGEEKHPDNAEFKHLSDADALPLLGDPKS